MGNYEVVTGQLLEYGLLQPRGNPGFAAIAEGYDVIDRLLRPPVRLARRARQGGAEDGEEPKDDMGRSDMRLSYSGSREPNEAR